MRSSWIVLGCFSGGHRRYSKNWQPLPCRRSSYGPWCLKKSPGIHFALCASSLSRGGSTLKVEEAYRDNSGYYLIDGIKQYAKLEAVLAARTT